MRNSLFESRLRVFNWPTAGALMPQGRTCFFLPLKRLKLFEAVRKLTRNDFCFWDVEETWNSAICWNFQQYQFPTLRVQLTRTRRTFVPLLRWKYFKCKTGAD